MSDVEKRVFRFGVFEADAGSGELRKSGTRVRLQEKPFQVLWLLLEHRGQLVTRDELRQKLWPADTFVDFDHSLNTIINKIREVLGDSASNPRFIETLAKRGYRFLLPVEESSRGKVSDESIATVRDQPASLSAFLTHPQDLPFVSYGRVRALFVLIQIMYLCFYLAALGRLSAAADLLDRILGHPWATVLLILSAAIGIPMRFYLLSAMVFHVKSLADKFLRLFPGILVLDELWALSPLLLAPQIGTGLALGITAALLYVPFAQRTLLLMRERPQPSPIPSGR